MISPYLKIDINKLQLNAKYILDLCNYNAVNPFAVVKVLSGDLTCVQTIIDSGYEYIADSRIDNLEKFQDLNCKKVLLRSTIPSEAKKVVLFSDISLETEIGIIEALNIEARMINKIHEIILMFDLGDLREGIFFKDEYLHIVKEILDCSFIKLRGIGTNLTCYGGIIPTQDNLQELIKIKNNIEEAFSIKLDIISGGNSSSLYLLHNNKIPNEINNLRIGEAIMLGRETAFGKGITNMYNDVFTLSSEIIELKNKPSFPIGISNMNAFGEKPNIVDKGIMKRALLPIGRQDVLKENIFPSNPKIELIGQSSDLLIVNVNNQPYYLGDTLSFNLNYAGLLQVMTSKYVKKIYINKPKIKTKLN